MEDNVDVIIVPQELLDALPKRPRKAVELLAAHPKGLMSQEIKNMSDIVSPSSACISKCALLAQYGYEIVQFKSYSKNECLWKLQKIAPKQEVKEVAGLAEKAFNVGDTAWYAATKFDEANIRGNLYLINPNDLCIECGLIENDDAIVKAGLSGASSSYIHAVKTLSSHSLDLIK